MAEKTTNGREGDIVFQAENPVEKEQTGKSSPFSRKRAKCSAIYWMAENRCLSKLTAADGDVMTLALIICFYLVLLIQTWEVVQEIEISYSIKLILKISENLAIIRNYWNYLSKYHGISVGLRRIYDCSDYNFRYGIFHPGFSTSTF